MLVALIIPNTTPLDCFICVLRTPTSNGTFPLPSPLRVFIVNTYVVFCANPMNVCLLFVVHPEFSPTVKLANINPENPRSNPVGTGLALIPMLLNPISYSALYIDSINVYFDPSNVHASLFFALTRKLYSVFVDNPVK
ncbi:MAG: hypothetical protein BWY95_01775 [Bacteroidetes bacterium ADurb.BinA104]|nr:MAG: hypothetical protein BWY95_01775 [Bacteroidetes bacterium ADurb.BinA104]